MHLACPHSRARRASALTAAFFGLLTLLAGGRIVFGFGDAGYTVVQPVLLFNTVMGAVYLVAALLIVRDVERGRLLAGMIALANVAVLLAIIVMRVGGGAVANETLAAMALRTGVWIVIGAMLTRDLSRSRALRPRT